MWPPSLLGILPDFRQWCLSVCKVMLILYRLISCVLFSFTIRPAGWCTWLYGGCTDEKRDRLNGKLVLLGIQRYCVCVRSALCLFYLCIVSFFGGIVLCLSNGK